MLRKLLHRNMRRPSSAVQETALMETHMSWHAPKFIEVSCGMEINRYAPADGNEPILF